MLGEHLEPQLPQLAAVQCDGAVSVEKVAIVERAMHKLSRPRLHPDQVDKAEQLLAEHAPLLRPADLKRFGCSFPGCTHPPQWCDRHHILDWILGGPTDLDTGTQSTPQKRPHFPETNIDSILY